MVLVINNILNVGHEPDMHQWSSPKKIVLHSLCADYVCDDWMNK